VYIGSAETVAVDSHLVMQGPDGNREPMRRVGDSIVWYQSLVVDDSELSVSYKFLVDSETALLNVHEIEELAKTQEGHTVLALDRHKSSQPDPFNPDRMKLDASISFGNEPDVLRLLAEDELIRYDSVLSLSEAASASTDAHVISEARDRDVTLRDYTIGSKVFGDDRVVTVHQPPAGTTAASVLFLMDGPGAIALGLPGLMEAMTERGEIRPTLTVYVHNKNSWSRSVEMICNPQLAEQYGDELLPWVRQNFDISDRAEDVVVSGGSYGGLGSAFLAFARPDLFGNVLSMSGSFWWGLRTAWGADPESGIYGFDDEPEWLTRQFAEADVTVTRFFLAAGTLESNHLPGGISMLSANRHLRTVLRAKGFDVTFHEFHGGHDRAGWRGCLLRGLPHLLPAKATELTDKAPLSADYAAN
jgi:enterochelin esterase-like enzyme